MTLIYSHYIDIKSSTTIIFDVFPKMIYLIHLVFVEAVLHVCAWWTSCQSATATAHHCSMWSSTWTFVREHHWYYKFIVLNQWWTPPVDGVPSRTFSHQIWTILFTEDLPANYHLWLIPLGESELDVLPWVWANNPGLHFRSRIQRRLGGHFRH